MGAHTLVLGVTESGKSTYCKWLCEALTRRRTLTAVLNPYLENDWIANLQTSDPDVMLQICRNIGKKAAFLDECGDALGRDPRFNWFTTGSRHKGNAVWVITQRLESLTPVLRNNCTECVLFASTPSDCKTLAEMFRSNELLEGSKLAKGEFFILSQFEPLKRGQLDWKSKTIKWRGK